MVEVREIKNSKNEVMTTKEGEKLVEYRLEKGDELIPVFNSVLEKTREATVKGKPKNITNYTIKARVRDKNQVQVTHAGAEEIFVTLTPAQAESLKKKVAAGVELNQNLWVAYEYESKDFGTQIGIGLKKANTPAKKFEDFN